MATHDDRLVGLEAPPPLELQVLSGRNGDGGLQSGALLQREEGQATLALGAARIGWKIKGQKCVRGKCWLLTQVFLQQQSHPTKKKTIQRWL